MSSSKSFTISTDKLPRFNGTHYKKWVDDFMPHAMMLDIVKVLQGHLVAPAPFTATKPVLPTPAADGTPPSTDKLIYFNTCLADWVADHDWTTKQQKEHDEKNTHAMGTLNHCLSFGIYEQIKSKNAADTWKWIHTTYATLQFIEIIEDFKFLMTFCLDLSDPTPQINKFRFHHSHLPTKTIISSVPTGSTGPAPDPVVTSQVSSSMAALILITALPLNVDPTQQSIYQTMVEAYHKAHPDIDNMDLDSLTEAIHTTWAACFRNIPESQ